MEVSRSLMGAIDVKKLLSEILNKARIVMEADRASLFMIDHDRNEIYASVTLDGSEIRLPRGTGIIGYVADSGETVNIPDAYLDARFNRINDNKTGYRTRSILCEPIRNQNQEIIGAIQVLNKLDGSVFTPEDEEMLASFSAMAGVSLENARAYEELAAERNLLEVRVAERTRDLAHAKAETDRILHAVEEGLFILYSRDSKFILGAGYSSALETILGNGNLAGADFLDLMGKSLEAQERSKAMLYLELMFDKTKKQAMLEKLNPLALARTHSGKVLRFHFDRVIVGAAIDHLLVTVVDATQEIELKEKLARTEAENKRHMELLHAILKSDPSALAEFVADIDTDLETVLAILGKASVSIADMTDIYRIIHSIKGNASLLNFSLLTEVAHALETTIDGYLSERLVSEGALVQVKNRVGELSDLSGEVSDWLARIAEFQGALAAESREDLIIRSIRLTIERASLAEKKDIRLDATDFRAEDLPSRHRKALKDLLIQMARNSVVHGIENVEARMRAKKSAHGTLRLRTFLSERQMQLVIEDDGGGIDGDKIAEKLIQKGSLAVAEANAMSASDKLQLIFRAGGSTSEAIGEFAGRGMGMSIVEESVRQMGGEIAIESERGLFTRFCITIALNN